ncbi:MAG: EboA domain-containing protein, partial [Hyphomicrobium sp.]
ARIASGTSAIALARAVGLAPRRVGRDPLQLDDEERANGEAVRPGLDASDWTVEQATRVLFVLASHAGGEASFAGCLEKLARSGEIGEQIALLRGLPLYPRPLALLPLASEGIRSAMQPIYEAVAHRSPYPAENFTEAMWNQMVVKALFIGSTLTPIQRLDERRNADLARMLADYAHERWAANRDVKPELWRCIGPFAEPDHIFNDLMRVFNFGDETERKAAALALAECPTPKALVALESAPELWRDIRNGKLTWETLA